LERAQAASRSVGTERPNLDEVAEDAWNEGDLGRQLVETWAVLSTDGDWQGAVRALVLGGMVEYDAATAEQILASLAFSSEIDEGSVSVAATSDQIRRRIILLCSLSATLLATAIAYAAIPYIRVVAKAAAAAAVSAAALGVAAALGGISAVMVAQGYSPDALLVAGGFAAGVHTAFGLFFVATAIELDPVVAAIVTGAFGLWGEWNTYELLR
jgi:hypothetical protein